ncbi:hypothetical protein [Spiroplasma endosymbiont of Nebria brevicollis]|uniref:hypothetical protein n=1 Tax=Spiroplasma endosymbiont of Nebria brevicollis TaxID=3066284 RepID=UPI00313CACB2
MKTFLLSLNFLGLSTFVTPIANLLSNSSVIGNNNLQVTDEYEVKSNYSYHSGWIEVDFDDTVLITTIYKEVDKLLLEQQETGIKKNIDVQKILVIIEPNNYIDFTNYETILIDVQKYIDKGEIDTDYYSFFYLKGKEVYSWDWAHAVPGYTWTYSKPDKSETLFTYYNYGYGNSDHSIYFKFGISHDS